MLSLIKRFSTLLMVCIFAYFGKAQNLVPNGDFETYTTCPNALRQVSKAAPWVTPTGGTADFYHGGAPCNFLPTSETACSGDGFGGVFTYMDPTKANFPDYREYLGVRLTQPLEAGKIYCISFLTKRFPFRGTYSSDGIGIFFSSFPLSSGTNKPLPYVPQFETAKGTTIEVGGGCITITGTFCAEGGEQYMTMGNFNDDANTTAVWDGRPHNNNQGGEIWPGAYYQIDAVSLTECAPEVTLSTGSVCPGSCIDINATASGGTPPYTFSWDGGPFGSGNSNNVCPSAETEYNVTVRDSNGCTLDSAAVTVTMNNCSVETLRVFTSDAIICDGACTDLIATGLDGVPPYTFTWDNGIGVGAGPHNVCPTTTTTYRVIITDGAGSIPDTAFATVTIAPPISVTATGTDVTCYNDKDGSATAAGTGGVPPLNYSWNTNPQSQGSVVSGLDTGTYEVKVSDALGCKDSAEIIIAQPPPLVTVPYGVDVGCDGDDGIAAIDVSGGAAPYTVVWNTDPVSTEDTVTGLAPGTYIVNITDDNRCLITDTVIISTGAGVPNAFWVANPESASIDFPEITFTDLSTDSILSWNWEFGDGDSSGVQHPIHNYDAVGTYTVTLTVVNEEGCSDVYVGTIVITPVWSFYVPNVFTPDGNGDNETFIGSGVAITNHKMWIYDRWGVMIYNTDEEKTGQVIPWNGRINNSGEPSPEDTYVYVVKITDIEGDDHKFIGHVSLIR